MSEFIVSADILEKMRQGLYVECKYFHPNSCLWESFGILCSYIFVGQKKYSVYCQLQLNFTVLCILFHQYGGPVAILLRTMKRFLRSCLFMALYAGILRYGICLFTRLRRRIDEWNVALAGLLAGFSLLIESEDRRGDLVLFMLPRVIEGLWNLCVSYKIVKPIKYGEFFVFALAMSIIMYCYHHKPRLIKPFYLFLFSKFWGKTQ